MLYKNMYSVNH